MDFQLSRPTYLDVEDACAEVEITRRQLAHWEEQGLLRPELGAGSRKYTPLDIRRLKYLRNLIVDRKLPLAFLKELLDAGEEASFEIIGALVESLAVFGDDEANLSEKVFEFASGRIKGRSNLAEEVRESKLPFFAEAYLQKEIKREILLLFRIMRVEHPHPADFADRYQEFLNEIELLARVARVKIFGNEEHGVYFADFQPELPTDEPIDMEEFTLWFLSEARRIDSFAKVVAERASRQFVGPKIKNRFWSEEALAAAQRDYDKLREDIPF